MVSVELQNFGSCPCVYGVPFGTFALASNKLTFLAMTTLASPHLAFLAIRNGCGLLGRVEGVDMWVYRNGRRQRLTG